MFLNIFKNDEFFIASTGSGKGDLFKIDDDNGKPISVLWDTGENILGLATFNYKNAWVAHSKSTEIHFSKIKEEDFYDAII
jgi:hypothetical protein